MTTDRNNKRDRHDPLDERIRRVVADAVAAAPPAPELPSADAASARVVDLRSSTSGRRRGLVLAALTAAAAVAVTAVVWPRNVDDRQSIVGASTSAPGTSSGVGTQVWPDDVAVIVANERGVFRVSSSGGELSTTALVDQSNSTEWGHSVNRAFEFADGSLLYQTDAGDILLQQPNLGTGVVAAASMGYRLEDAGRRPDGTIIYAWSQTRPDLQSQPLWFGVSEAAGPATPIFEAPRGNQLPGQLDRLTFLSPQQFVAGEASDLFERYGSTFDLAGGSSPIEGADTAARLVGDGAYSIGLLEADGTFRTTGRRVVGPVQVAPAGVEVADLDLRGDALVVNVGNKRPKLHLLSAGAVFDVPLNGTATIVRTEQLGGGQPEPTATTSTVVDTTVPPPVNPTTGCIDFTVSPKSDLKVEVGTYGFYSLEPIPSEPISVDGRPAVLQSWGGGLAALLSPPYWCSTLSFTLYPPADGSPVDKAAFLQWLATVDVTETLPAGMPPVVLAGRLGVAVVDGNGTTTVTTKPAFRAVLMPDGSVVWQELGNVAQPASGVTVHRWDPATGNDTELWAAVDWVATPILHDALPDGRLVWSVGDTLLIGDPVGIDSVSMPLGMTPSGRLSVNLRDQLVAGEGLYGTIDQAELSAAPAPPDYWRCTSACAFEMDGATVVLASATDLRVVDRTTGDNLFSMPWGDSVITDVDIRGTWLSYYAEPLGDSDSMLRVVDYATGFGFAFQGWTSAHFSRASLTPP
jgi:hypothetical protein